MGSDMSFDAYDNPGYQIAMYVSGVFAVLFGVLGIYFVWFKSPPSFGPYKYFLLNIVLWAFAFDLYVGVFFQPKLMFPALVMCPNGLINTDNVFLAYASFYLVMVLLGAISTAVLAAFIYRFATLYNYEKLVVSKPFVFGLALLHIFYETPSLVMYTLALGDRNKIIAAIVNDYPLIQSHLKHQACAAVHTSVGATGHFILPTFAFQFSMGAPLIVFLIYKCRAALHASARVMSRGTLQMQKDLLRSLIFQMLIPMLTIFGPFTILIIAIMAGVTNVAYIIQAIYAVSTFHSILNTTLMLRFIKPYRLAFLGIVKRRVYHENAYTSDGGVSLPTSQLASF